MLYIHYFVVWTAWLITHCSLSYRLSFLGKNDKNTRQAILQSGQRPTILQQLCSLPFEYFSDERLKGILFPTLISCCFDHESNRGILEQEMSPLMLSSFLEVGSLYPSFFSSLFPSLFSLHSFFYTLLKQWQDGRGRRRKKEMAKEERWWCRHQNRSQKWTEAKRDAFIRADIF